MIGLDFRQDNGTGPLPKYRDTLDELYKNLNEALEGYIETKLENNLEIPRPANQEAYSGKFMVRIPKSLHMRLELEAEREGVSLDQYALYKLTR